MDQRRYVFMGKFMSDPITFGTTTLLLMFFFLNSLVKSQKWKLKNQRSTRSCTCTCKYFVTFMSGHIFLLYKGQIRSHSLFVFLVYGNNIVTLKTKSRPEADGLYTRIPRQRHNGNLFNPCFYF